ncbi:MAG: HD domain-containing protein [Acidobacteria bacterium]|nr:HD domain-containing protein [Acidobacteriota bacterium]
MQVVRRIPLLYLIGSVLVLVSVVPIYFYGTNVIAISRDRLKTNEMLLQNSITSSLSDDLEQRHQNMLAMLANLRSAIEISSGGNLSGEHVQAPELRALLEQFVSSSPDLAYATLVNADKKGIRAGRTRTEDDPFMQAELERAFTAAWDGRQYQGEPLRLGAGRDAHTILLLSMPVVAGGRFVGLIGVFIDLDFLIRRLKQVSQGQLQAYVVDGAGRLIAGADPAFATGQDMTRFEIARNFVEQGQSKRLAATKEFRVYQGNKPIDMLGTYSPIASLDWAVVAQKPREAAYASVNELQRTAQWLALGAALASLLVSLFSARKIATPLRTLTEQSRAISRGDFSERVQVSSRTEIGELAETFNLMTDDLERLVGDLKRAADENLTLFLSSIQMLAGAVDEKDPYTRGHSDRVTRYSVLIATEMGLPKEEIERIRIAAQLHDVGKIGIEDRILKKPGPLTPEEFEIMKTHTIKGANILRPVRQLRDMLPGIELHHEALDGRGYPFGLKGDQIPLMPRIIMVADTFDAMTTIRPYQSPISPETAVRRIQAMVDRYDQTVVAALVAVFQRNELGVEREDTAVDFIPEMLAAEIQPV